MIGRRLVVALFVACAATPLTAGAQVQVTVRDAGPGKMGRLVNEVLARPHAVFADMRTPLVLPRDTTIDRSIVAIGRDVYVAAAVQGDVVAINGDVFLRPGARIDGDVIATGGAVYDSFLAVVRGDRHSFRDATLQPVPLPEGGYALDYEALRQREVATFSLPGIYGVRLPQYDRVNGVTLPAGPLFQLGGGRLSVEPLVTYRSHLGKLDPSVLTTLSVGRANRIEIEGARTSRTNDAWIQGNFSNSLGSIVSGRDTRNWYRADLAQARFHRRIETPSAEVTPFVGAQWERAWTTGIQDPPRHLAYSFTERTDTIEGMARPNPVVDRGTIASAVAGFEGQWQSTPHELEVRASGLVEGAPEVVGDRRFAQLTLDGRVTFPLIRKVMFRFEWHGVATAGDAPPQRFAWLGGSGTLKTLELLEQGGDQLLFTETRAWLPLDGVRLPVVGSPTVMLRHMMGGAGIGGLPALTHNLAARIGVSLVRFEFVIDPVSGETDTSFGVALSR
ncbi:MAG TPA: hypothetical protein VFT96_05425 [Gemmatimonadaceae bacterium]|nr:hypothetical protein [Gemmatimonadaceae bacterium]